MNFAPLANASFAIQLHTAAALLSAVCGIAVLLRAKGTLSHKTIGYIFSAAMIVTALSSFWITGISPGRYSWIHILSVVTLIGIAMAIYYRRKGNIRLHAANMIFPFAGLIVAGAFTFAPGRIMNQMFFGP